MGLDEPVHQELTAGEAEAWAVEERAVVILGTPCKKETPDGPCQLFPGHPGHCVVMSEQWWAEWAEAEGL
jgi:hypothetical protein